MDYWKECIIAGLEDAGIEATDEQIELLAGAVEGGFENYNMAFGYDVAHKNFEHEDTIKLRQLKAEIENKEEWINSTKPCRACTTTGWVKDGWGRPSTCFECDGKGRVPINW